MPKLSITASFGGLLDPSLGWGFLNLLRFYGEHNLACQEYPPKTAILAHVPSRSVCPWDIKK